MTPPTLQLDKLTMRFGGLTAVDNFSLSMNSNDLVGVIGPNGAGKTTIFNMITGNYFPTSGKIILEGEDVTGIRPATITQKGICRTFQNIRLFKDLSLLENILIAYHFKTHYSLLAAIFRTKRCQREEKEKRENAFELLKIFRMDKMADTLAKNLPYGDQRRLEMARALATGPKILLLDEPAAGMGPSDTLELIEQIKWIKNRFNVGILLIEHDMKLVMNVCQKIYVVDHGVCIAQGRPKEIQENPKVIEAYLGSEACHE